MKKILTIFLLIFAFYAVALADDNIYIRGFEFSGNTVFSTQKLTAIVAGYINQEVSLEELIEIKKKVAHYYVDQGYMSSRALLEIDQDSAAQNSDGMIPIRIIEGRLTEIRISGNQYLWTVYIEERLKMNLHYKSGMLLNINDIQKALKLLKKDPRIKSIKAQIIPKADSDEAVLSLTIIEEQAWHASMSFNNYVTPGLGAPALILDAGTQNFTGRGDTIQAKYKFTHKPYDFGLSYRVPLSAKDTTLSMSAGRRQTLTSEMIEYKTITYALELHYPVYKTLLREFSMGIGMERQLNKPNENENGENIQSANIIRISQEWVKRSTRQVAAARSLFSFGLDVGDITALDEEYPDGRFVAWNGSFQLLKKMAVSTAKDSLWLLRLDMQVATDPLLPMEKFIIGGSDGVRGYPQKLNRTDNGAMASLEWRIQVAQLQIPMPNQGFRDGDLELCSFFDCGRGWNSGTIEPDPDGLLSAGLGLRWSLEDVIHAEFYWGHAFRDFDTPGEYTLQKNGVHFNLTINFL